MAEAVGSGGCEHSSVLTWDQVSRLNQVLTEVVPVHGRGNFPTLGVCLKDVVQTVRARLQAWGIAVNDVRLNGSTASHVLVEDEGWSYKDLDLIFRVDLPQEAGFQAAEAGFQAPGAGFQLVLEAVLHSLLDFLPSGVNKEKMSPVTLKEAYVQKLVKVSTDADRWSLISLCNNDGRNIELKFVDRIRRQFEFSVDSFQIVLDPMLEQYRLRGGAIASESPFPAVVVESVYGDFAEALGHLRDRLIATRRPEEIRGGGLLKYCSLLARGFRPADPQELRSLQRYMCSRFFIDFSDVCVQRRKLDAYLRSHFAGEESCRYAYLMVLRRVVDESTVCLMGHERRQTLSLISLTALRVLAEQNAIPDASCVTCFYQPAPYAQDPNFCPYYCGQTLPTWQPCS
ncbi:hypothetical protein SKAU_G00345320 [Synaphobranchus kaupii]|uniref:Terminal nucleotidyltransferase 5C n=1 Tax=Synaphobranchus kaupii TaxID=118154 RepID=A0A9Q1IHN7_SYNKA|nr:hypothetical protein SKAU_G00345320 [Synaphobranchus kaupii]